MWNLALDLRGTRISPRYFHLSILAGSIYCTYHPHVWKSVEVRVFTEENHNQIHLHFRGMTILHHELLGINEVVALQITISVS